MRENTIEWNLGFARDEVEDGVKKLLAGFGCAYTCSETGAETRFGAILTRGSLEAVIRPLSSQPGPFNLPMTRERTLLAVTYTGLSAEEEEALKHRLTLTFLRVGG
jgi:hypothetical protein